MVITLICDVFGAENNGTTITAKRLIEGLQKRGHSVRMVSTFESDDEMFYTVPKRSFGPFDNYVAKNGVSLAKKDEDTIRKAITGADIVHILLPFVCGAVAVKICKELNVPFTTAFHAQAENVTTHFGMKNFRLANKLVYHIFKNKLFAHTNYIHCPTKFIADTIEKEGYTAKKYIISNGVSKVFKRSKVSKPKEFSDKFVILTSGRYSKEKCHDLIIKAMKYSKHAEKIQLIFAGHGPLKEKYQKLSKKLKNPLRLCFLKKEELNQTINYSDLYVHPADIEIEGISCIEALTCGKVPIVSDSDRAATKFFALDNRSIFKKGNAKDLAQKIDYFIENPNVLKDLSNKYEEMAKQFDIDACHDKIVQMFEDCINESK